MFDFNLTGIRRGDTIRLRVPVVREGVAVDLTGAKLWITGKRWVSDSDANAIFQGSTDTGEITIQTPSNGIAIATLPPSFTENLQDTTIVFTDIQLLEAGGVLTTVASGILNIEADITRVRV